MQTRRNWFVTIGEVTVGLSAAGSLPCYSADAVDLPPGVYLPSKDDLSHALMNSERYHPIPPGCPTDYVRPADAASHPLFFSEAEFKLVTRLIELLLGKVSDQDTPQEVPRWVDLRVSSAAGVRQALEGLQPLYRTLASAYFGSPEASRYPEADLGQLCRQGLKWIEESAHEQYSKYFLSLGDDQQVALLHSISDEVPRQAPSNAGSQLFKYLKSETVRGYYTSRTGLRELDFKGNAYYAQSPGCTNAAH
jgi:hypothetical protein